MRWIYAYLLCGVASYLLGAVPFGYLMARLNGIDIRQVGSGNIGATNVARALGKGWGLLTFSCDVLKGFGAVLLFPGIAEGLLALEKGVALRLLCACLAVAGHNWPVYLRFKGGKGVATSAGALLAIAWEAATIGIMSWTAVFLLTRYVSVASMFAAVVIAIAAWLLYAGDSTLLPSVLTLLAALAILRHKSNIRRLIRGEENRFELKKKGVEQPSVGINEKESDNNR